MIRIASQRLLVASRTPGASIRPLSTTPGVMVKIRRPDGTTSSPPSSPPSPAERPPKPPADVSSAPPPLTEPKVSHNGSSKNGGPPPSPPKSTPATPLEPPSPTRAEKPVAPKKPQRPVAPTTPDQATAPVSGPEIEPEIDLSKLPSLDVDSELARLAQPEADKEETGGKSRSRTGAGRKEYVSSIERQRRAMLRWGIGSLVVGGLGYLYFGVDDKPSEAGAPTVGVYDRLKNNTSELFDYFNKPAFKTLLPEPLPAPHQRPYTLLVDLEGMLTTSTWDRQHGWRTAKRPGTDYFLAYLSLFYEIVLFTSQPSYTAMAVADKLDPFQAYIPYKLYRESTRTVDGKVVKDLSYLNRDLSKVILLDTNPEHAALQPENAIIIKPWEGKGGEQGLVELIPFLESLAFLNVKDVRPILQAYQGKDIPQEYAKIEAEQKRIAVQEWERAHPSAGAGALTSILGRVSSPGRSKANQPMTYIEQKRAQAQAQYLEEQKYWREHADEFAKLIEEDKARQLAEMKGSLWNMMAGPNKPAAGEAEKKA